MGFYELNSRIREDSLIRAFHDVDGACQWQLGTRKDLEKASKHRPAEQLLEQFQVGSNRMRFETCWCKQNDDSPAYIRAIRGVNPEFLKNETDLSFKFAKVLGQKSVER